MRPPICRICRRRFDPHEGGLVTFSQSDADRAWEARARGTPGFVGHPPWKEWFCAAHVERARALSDLTRGQAMEQMGG